METSDGTSSHPTERLNSFICQKQVDGTCGTASQARCDSCGCSTEVGEPDADGASQYARREVPDLFGDNIKLSQIATIRDVRSLRREAPGRRAHRLR